MMLQCLPSVAMEALQQFYCIAHQAVLWSGFRPEETPLVLHSADRAYLINHPCPPDGFVELDALAGRTVHVGQVTPVMTANTAQTVGNVLCAMAAIPVKPPEPQQYARLLLHECFHVFQQKELPAVAPPDFTQMERYPESDPVNNALAIVENRLLVAALEGDSTPISGFLAVRQFRQSRLEPDLSVYEAVQEYNEGTPTYIEVKAGKPVGELASLLGECNLAGKWAAYRRFYMTGAVIALLLDRLSPGWHNHFANGGTTLQGLLQGVGGPLPSSEEVLARAGYAEILAFERDREAERQRAIGDLIARLESGPDYRVEIDTSNTPYFSWDPTHCLVVKPGIRLHTRWLCLQNGGSIKVEITGIALEDRTRNILLTRLGRKPAVTGENPFRFEGGGLQGQAPRGVLEPLGDGYRIRLEGD